MLGVVTRAAILALATAVPGCAAAAWTFAVCGQADLQPYSAEDGSGFDNRIAAEIAEGLGADLEMVWLPDTRQRTALQFLHGGLCDAVFGVIDGQPGMLTSHAYYRTGYVFVARAKDDPGVTSLDDPALDGLVVGLPGGAMRPTPPSVALVRRGRGDALRHFGGRGGSRSGDAALLAALEAGEIDLAIMWGPSAGGRAAAGADVRIAPLRPEIDIPFLPMIASFTIGVRPHDEALRDAIDAVLTARWERIGGLLEAAGVPRLDLPPPQGARP